MPIRGRHGWQKFVALLGINIMVLPYARWSLPYLMGSFASMRPRYTGHPGHKKAELF